MYEFLKQEPLPGGYHENRKFIFQVRDRLIDQIDDEVRTSMGLVEERRYIEQFERYVTHVSHWVKREKVRNPITGRDEDPDEEMMGEVERILEVGSGEGRREEFRREVISRIGAWSIDHPDGSPTTRRSSRVPSPICASRSSATARSRSGRSTRTCWSTWSTAPARCPPTRPRHRRRRSTA